MRPLEARFPPMPTPKELKFGFQRMVLRRSGPRDSFTESTDELGLRGDALSALQETKEEPEVLSVDEGSMWKVRQRSTITGFINLMSTPVFKTELLSVSYWLTLTVPCANPTPKIAFRVPVKVSSGGDRREGQPKSPRSSR